MVDYAFPPQPSLDQLRSIGATAVSRYLSYDNVSTHGKILTRAEFESLSNAGFEVILNWEFDARDLINPGFNAADAATHTVIDAHSMGYNDFRVIYFSADFDVQASDWPLMRSRLNSIASVIDLSRVGLYGPWDALEWARRDHVASWFWQAGMSTAWSGGRNAKIWPYANLRQRGKKIFGGGVEVDISDILTTDYGQRGIDMDPVQDARLRNIEAILWTMFTGGDKANIFWNDDPNSQPSPFPESGTNSFREWQLNVSDALSTGAVISPEDRQLATDFINAVNQLTAHLK